MSFLINVSEEDVIKEEAYGKYTEYLDSIRHRIPKAVYDFATADWHYDSQNPMCPHDAWIQEIKVSEIPEGERQQVRKTRIEVFLLGAYHDRLQKVTYEDVRSYSISSSQSKDGHGDWLIDEIGLSDAGFVIHEVKFSLDAFLKVECGDIIFEEQLTATPYRAAWLSGRGKTGD